MVVRTVTQALDQSIKPHIATRERCSAFGSVVPAYRVIGVTACFESSVNTR